MESTVSRTDDPRTRDRADLFPADHLRRPGVTKKQEQSGTEHYYAKLHEARTEPA